MDKTSHGEVTPGAVFQHVKGGVYQVAALCTIEATDTPAVAYKSLNVVARDDIWVRPLAEFCDRFSPLGVSLVDIAEQIKHGPQ